MRWNEIQVPPPPTKAPSANSASVWRPSSSLAQNTGGRSAKAGKPHAPNTYARQTAAPETPAVWSDRLLKGVMSTKPSVASA